eukprot:scaffold184263_cov19-Prasinocladus_malaysianus.AAC.1
MYCSHANSATYRLSTSTDPGLRALSSPKSLLDLRVHPHFRTFCDRADINNAVHVQWAVQIVCMLENPVMGLVQIRQSTGHIGKNFALAESRQTTQTPREHCHNDVSAFPMPAIPTDTFAASDMKNDPLD